MALEHAEESAASSQGDKEFRLVRQLVLNITPLTHSTV